MTSVMAEQEKRGQKRKVLTLEQRVKVLKMADEGKSGRAIAAELQVGKTQVHKIVKDKENLMKEWEDGGNTEKGYQDKINRL